MGENGRGVGQDGIKDKSQVSKLSNRTDGDAVYFENRSKRG